MHGGTGWVGCPCRLGGRASCMLCVRAKGTCSSSVACCYCSRELHPAGLTGGGGGTPMMLDKAQLASDEAAACCCSPAGGVAATEVPASALHVLPAPSVRPRTMVPAQGITVRR